MHGHSFSTDQVEAFVELAQSGSLRAAAENLHITEQGLRNRIITLENILGVELYRKSRGLRRVTPLTSHGQLFLPKAMQFMNEARSLSQIFTEKTSANEVHVIASQYLISYVMVDVVSQFHAKYQDIRIRLSSRTEEDIERSLLTEPQLQIGFAAPYELPRDLFYDHLFSMNWSFIAASRHPLLKSNRLTLQHIAREPLIVFEQGSTGRQHIMEAFGTRGISPTVEMEVTNTDTIVRMTEAKLGVSIVPLYPTGAVTRGRKVGVKELGSQIRPIHSGILTRKGETLSEAAILFLKFTKATLKCQGK